MLRLPVLLGVLACAGCSSKRPPPVAEYVPPPEAGEAGVLAVPTGPPLDDAGLCGRIRIPIVVDRPNLYFVLDASGSMQGNMDKADPDGIIPKKYDAARLAIQSVLLAIGHRVNYGAALFPAVESDAGSSCAPGGEVFPTTAGDPVSVRISGKTGNVLQSLHDKLLSYAPSGGTPTAATLRALDSKILALPGKTYVFLLTDGAPNCDPFASCSAAGCSINIEGGCSPADPQLNCCDPRSGSGGSNLDCVDGDATVSAISDYAAKGVRTYVIGMPGTSFYASLLDRMALAGQTAQTTEPFYYPVDSTQKLTDDLARIGLSVSVSCRIDLSEPPPDPRLVNVYFDQSVVKRDPADGWTWTDGGDAGDGAVVVPPDSAEAGADAGALTHIEIVGEKCDELKRGDVLEVQVVAGCPSVVK